jgi:hypothetical protein
MARHGCSVAWKAGIFTGMSGISKKLHTGLKKALATLGWSV